MDKAALVALYDATDGPNWKNSQNWLSDEPIRNWHGVVTDHEGRVVELFLHENNLNGTIPPEIAELSELTSLRLDTNGLRGVIPPYIGRLSQLYALLLHDN